MFTLAPQNFLDRSLCFKCGKYLSVLPVTVSEDGKKRCGSCANKEFGVLSNYNKLAVGMLFSCVNRYEGCYELLLPHQVLKHEVTCKSKKYECPLCVDQWICSYAMIEHFRQHHSGSVLSKPEFAINRNTMYMYYTDRNIFFIHVLIDVTKIVTLTVYCMGPNKVAKSLMCTFRFNKCEYNGLPLQRFYNNALEVSLLNGRDITNCELIIIYDYYTPLDMFKMKNHISQRNQLSLPDYRKTKERRIISVDEQFFKHNTWKLSPCKTSLVNIKNPAIKLYSSCDTCGFIIHETNIYGCGVCFENHLSCGRCYKMNLLCPGKFKYNHLPITYKYIFSQLKFHCKWQCQESFVSSQLCEHEMNCTRKNSLGSVVCIISDIPNDITLESDSPQEKTAVVVWLLCLSFILILLIFMLLALNKNIHFKLP